VFFKKNFFGIIIILLIVIAAIMVLFKGEDERSIVFFSGAGMKVPASEIVKNFTDLTGISVDVHFEGSAILRRYIETYEDADLFMSGDKKNMEMLIQKGLVKEHSFIAWHIPSILIPPENKNKIKGLNDLAQKGIRFVMSNPEQAASGRMAHEAISRHPWAKDILGNVSSMVHPQQIPSPASGIYMKRARPMP
jgi:ABC-type molybdate transport system substrate-binding protein